jgi:glyoxylase-like metal-dependent hydrolase (beta-lactamase superfamily II)
MKVHHLNCGTMRPWGGRLIDGSGSVFRAARLVAHVLLVEAPQGLVLVDTGFGTGDVHDPVGSLGRQCLTLVRPVLDVTETAVRQVAALGYDPADVRHIVLTHLDLDHAGGLRDFPNAIVHVHAEELAAMRNRPTANERSRYRLPQFAHDPKFASYATGAETWFDFAAVRPLDGLGAEILLVPLAGHTRGHCGVAVDTGDGWLLHAGDGYYFHGQLETPRHRPAGIGVFETLAQVDGRARIANQERLRDLVSAHGTEVTVFSAHDGVELERLSGM